MMDKKGKKKAKNQKKLDLKKRYKEKHPEEFVASSSSEEEECCLCSSGESMISSLQRRGIIGPAFKNPIDAIMWGKNNNQNRCDYCKERIEVSKDEHLKVCPKFLGSFEEQYESNDTKLDPTSSRCKIHIETVRKVLLDLEENDDIGIFACGDVMSHFPTLFSEDDKSRVHSLMMKRLPYCTDFFIKDRRLKVKYHPSGTPFNISIQTWFLDNGGW